MDNSLHNYGAELIRVIDGDTIVAKIDLGFDIWMQPSTIRFPRINAPEIDTRAGRESKSFLENFLNHSFSLGGRLTVSPCTRKKDKYGRYLCEIWMCEPTLDPVNLSDLMVEEKKASIMAGKMGVHRGKERAIPESQMKQFIY